MHKPTKMIISMIACMAKNRVIGSNNRIPWYIPLDLIFFKNTTINHPVIMGKNTFLSLKKPLEGRLNIVISKTLENCDGVLIFKSLEEALDYLKFRCTECFIIGGEKMYKEGLKYCDFIYLNKIDKNFKGDIYFPKIPTVFKIISQRMVYTGDYKLTLTKYQKTNLNYFQYLINRFMYLFRL